MYKMQGATHKGMQREHNEDRFACNMLGEDFGYAVVCDGIGGAQGGSQASTMACEEIRRSLETAYRPGLEERSVYMILETALENANVAVYDQACQEEQQGRMGTTASLAVVTGNTCYMASVGDSRIYLLRAGALQQLTVDHTRVQDLLSKGEITEEEAKDHPHRHYLTNAVGVFAKIRPAFCQTQLEPGDLLLLCSDGLYNMVEEPQLVALLHRIQKGEDCQLLIDAANAQGGVDNITAVAVISTREEEHHG